MQRLPLLRAAQEPKQYSLRKGQVGRLQEAVATAAAVAAAANAAAAAAGLSTTW